MVIDLSANALIDGISPSLSTPEKFLLLLFWVYVVHIFVYLLSGFFLSWLNQRNHHRKIQQHESKVPALKEIKQGFISLFASSICLVMAIYVQYLGWSLSAVDMLVPSWEAVFWFLFFFTLLAFLSDLWFYAEHRLVHTRWLIAIHKEHHLSPIPTPWTNDRFRFVEVMMIQSFMVVIVFVLPVPAIVLVAHRLYDQIKGMIGHCGYEYFQGLAARSPWPFACVSYHDAHHQKFSVNYGNLLTIWDRIFGTIDPDYDENVSQLIKRYRVD